MTDPAWLRLGLSPAAYPLADARGQFVRFSLIRPPISGPADSHVGLTPLPHVQTAPRPSVGRPSLWRRIWLTISPTSHASSM